MNKLKKFLTPVIALFVMFGCVMLCSDRTPTTDIYPPEVDLNSHTNMQAVGDVITLYGKAEDAKTGIDRVFAMFGEDSVRGTVEGKYWTITYTNDSMAEPFTVKYYALDEKKNQSELQSLTLIPADLPSVLISYPENGETLRKKKTVVEGTVIADEEDSIAEVNISMNFKDYQNVAIDPNDQSWTLEIPEMNAGMNRFRFQIITESGITNVETGYMIRHNPIFPLDMDTWIENGIDALTDEFSDATKSISKALEIGIDGLVTGLSFLPAFIMILIIGGLAWWLGNYKVAIFAVVGMAFIWATGLWEPMISTLALVLIATFLAVIIGLPIGIWAALNSGVNRVVTPVLDFMQTMPAFVYLIPAIPFFGLGPVSAIFATVIFAIPPSIRLTTLGIKQIPSDLIEAADAFGSNKSQKLFKLQLPLATPTIMAGVNQTIMLSLSMVVIAAMIGAGGLGGEVWKAIQRMKSGQGFVAGLAVVVVAMILDRITQKITARTEKHKQSQ